MPPSASAPVLAVICFAASAGSQGPVHAPPLSVGIDYPILACKLRDNRGVDASYLIPDGSNASLQVGPGADLVVVFPDGSEKVLVDASDVTGNEHASCVDPCVSFDGSRVFCAIHEDPRVFDLPYGNRQVVPARPAHIWRIDIHSLVPAVVATATQLTFGDDVAYADQGHAEVPHHRLYDVAPVELPDGRLLFLSNRSNVMDVHNRRPAMRFYRMHADGSNIEPLENFTQVACQHPIVLMDGRIVWTHTHLAGRRGPESDHLLMVANPDLSDVRTFAGAHNGGTVLHFLTQLSPGPQSPQGQGDIVVAAYYPGNNFGHGNLIRFPVHNPSGAANAMRGISDDLTQASAMWTDQQLPLPNGNTHFQRVGERLVTPWALRNGSLDTDEDSPFLPGTTIYAGKATMPAAAPDGDLLFVWSPGAVNGRPQHAGRPDMKIAFAPGGMTDAMQNDMTVVREDTGFHYLFPRALVPYERIYGIDRPAVVADTRNDGVPAILPAGGPFGTIGTASVYNRESRWPAGYADAEGPDPWDPAILGSPDYRLRMAFKAVGQDTRPYGSAEIHGVQIVADMSHYFTSIGHWMNQAPGYVFRSHNTGSQVWGILGEAPLRKTDADGQPVFDPWGDPDTSFEVRVPADTPFHSRLIDANGLTLTAEQTWHSVRAGERRTGCGGCHAHSEDLTPRDFSQCFAGTPGSGYRVTDMALQTPLLRERNGQREFGADADAANPRVKIVEWFRDIKPIVDAKCASCHSAQTNAGKLDLASPDAWDRLAYTPGSDPAKRHPTYATTQATRYVRKHSAAQSLLIWRIFGARLDGRTNAQRPTSDIDYVPAVEGPMPPVGSPGLTFDEKRLFAMWVDLGCLVDLTAPGPGQLDDPFDDQMQPVLTVSGIEPGRTTQLPAALVIGVYDLHSGIAPQSLDVHFAGSAQNLAAGRTVSDGSIVRVDLGSPALPRGQTYTLEVSVADRAGNVARRTITTTPLHAATAVLLGPGSPGTGAVTPRLEFSCPPRLGAADFGARLTQALPATAAVLFASFAAQDPPLLLAPGVPFYLQNPALVATGVTDLDGAFAAPLPLPDYVPLSGLQAHFQGAVLDPKGAVMPPGVGVALSPGLTATLGW